MKDIRCEKCGALIAKITDDGYLSIMCNHSMGRGEHKKKCKHPNVIRTGIKVDIEDKAQISVGNGK